MSKPIVGYWDVRGLCEPIRYTLHHVGVEFEDKRYKRGPPPEYDRSDWLKEKFNLGLDFPNLPYLIDGEVRLTQSLAILRHLARKFNLVAQNEKEQSRLEMFEQFCVDFRTAFSRVTYSADFEKLKVDYLANLPHQLELATKFLGSRQYFGGDRVTYVDFLFYEAVDCNRILQPTCLDKFESLKQFMERIEGLPAIAKYMKSGKFSRLPINGPTATFGGKKE